MPKNKLNFNTLPDQNGRFGDYGGMFVSETLVPALNDLNDKYKKIKNNSSFKREVKIY
ncbi:hypothetical protein CM15mP43_10000 [bacterium]|nr:MAG: hypothetical protein CM15mP43_10000 [bacterium]